MELTNLRCCCPGPASRPAKRRQLVPVAVAAPDKDTLQSAHNAESNKEGFVPGLNTYSKRITQPKAQGASQAMLYATGLREEDLGKAQVRQPPLQAKFTRGFMSHQLASEGLSDFRHAASISCSTSMLQLPSSHAVDI